MNEKETETRQKKQKADPGEVIKFDDDTKRWTERHSGHGDVKSSGFSREKHNFLICLFIRLIQSVAPSSADKTQPGI